MRKLSLLAIMLLVCLPISMRAQDDQTKYLEGAVPVIDGKVVFERELSLPGVKQNAIYERMLSWATERMKEAEAGRVVYSDPESGSIVAVSREYLVFSSSALSLDRTILDYQLTIINTDGTCKLELSKIRYTYQEKEKYTAEEWITDEYALNKSKTKLVRGIAKFRTKTIDFAEELFDSAQAALGITKVKPLETENNATYYPPLVATEAAVTTTTTTVVSNTPAPVVTVAAIPAIESSNKSLAKEGYKEIAPERLPGNIYKMLTDNWMLITAGTPESFNMMTASWGGLGRLYEKPVAFCFITPTNYTHDFMAKNEVYTLSFYTEAYREALQYCGSHSGRDTDKVKGSGLSPIDTPEGGKAFSEAWMIVECRRLIDQSLNTSSLTNEAIKAEWIGKPAQTMFIGEIVRVWVK